MKREGFEKTCRNEKDHKVRAKMVAVRMVLVLNTAGHHNGTARRRMDANLRRIVLDNAVFSGSTHMMPPDSH